MTIRTLVLAALLATACTPPSVQAPSAAPAAGSDARAFDGYVGQYASRDGEHGLSVFRDEGRHWLQPAGFPWFELEAASRDTFTVPAIGGTLTFTRDTAGRVLTAQIHSGGRDYPVQYRKSDVPVIVRFTEMTRIDTMIPMRDGVRLHTVIFAPAARSEPLPILLERTPYGVGHWDGNGINMVHRSLVRDGYIFAFQDIRGRFKSEGDFQMFRPPAAAAAAGSEPVDESTDAYDTIDWLVRHVEGNNGRVGVRGVSYAGWLATMALRDPHPALRAASPQAPVGDLFVGDDFFHNGAFRLSYAYEFVRFLETSRELTQTTLEGPGDAYDWYLALGPLANVDATHLQGRLPTWNAFAQHPQYDDYWKARAVANQINRTGDRRVPTLVVGGRWDQEDPLGPLVTYAALERGDVRGENTLVLGPWSHGQWSGGTGRRLGAIDWGSATSLFFRDSVEAPWFAHHLRGAPAASLPEALVFRSGVNRWQRYARWPAGVVDSSRGASRGNAAGRTVYLRESGALAFAPPTVAGDTAADGFVSDPADPVPYRKRPITPTFGPTQRGWFTWLAEDQRFLEGRADVLQWQTPPLAEDVTVTGDVVARLFASVTGSDADWVVKLIDVYPDSGAPTLGADTALAEYRLMVAGDILRGRYRRGLDQAVPIKAGAIEPYDITLRAVDHTFRRGHRIMVQVQSSWFPLYDRNPQTFVPNIFGARSDDFTKASHRVHRSARHPSQLLLPEERHE